MTGSSGSEAIFSELLSRFSRSNSLIIHEKPVFCDPRGWVESYLPKIRSRCNTYVNAAILIAIGLSDGEQIGVRVEQPQQEFSWQMNVREAHKFTKTLVFSRAWMTIEYFSKQTSTFHMQNSLRTVR